MHRKSTVKKKRSKSNFQETSDDNDAVLIAAIERIVRFEGRVTEILLTVARSANSNRAAERADHQPLPRPLNA